MFNQLCAGNQNQHSEINSLAGNSLLIISQEPALFIHINAHSKGKGKNRQMSWEKKCNSSANISPNKYRAILHRSWALQWSSNKTKLLYKVHKQSFEEALSGWILAKSKSQGKQNTQWYFNEVLAWGWTVKFVLFCALKDLPFCWTCCSCMTCWQEKVLCMPSVDFLSFSWLLCQSVRCNLQSV